MDEYEKIETLFVRDSTTKRLVEGQYRSGAVEYLKDNAWRFTEKVDGTNTRVIWDGYRVSFAGRTANSQMPQKLTDRLNALFGRADNEQLFEQKFGSKSVIIFGEGYGAGIQNGGLYRNDIDFMPFDVKVDGKYLSLEDVKEVSGYFNLKPAPIVLTGTIEDGVKYVKSHPHSLVAQSGAYMEGLVGRPSVDLQNEFGNRIIVKIKYRDF